MSPTDELPTLLKKLRMSGVLETLELRTREATDENLAHTEFLYRLIGDEVQRREAKQLDQRLRKASFVPHKSLENFDFLFNPNVPKAKVVDLATCRFIERRENVLLLGPTGVGKSHLAQAIGQRACLCGHDVLFQSAHEVLGSLRAARADGTYERKLARLVSIDLLIIDDLGLRPLAGQEPIDLYELIRLRYEQRSLIITSNRAVQEWVQLFGDELMAGAAMDRLLHHAHVIEITGDSYRNPPKGKRAKKVA